MPPDPEVLDRWAQQSGVLLQQWAAQCEGLPPLVVLSTLALLTGLVGVRLEDDLSIPWTETLQRFLRQVEESRAHFHQTQQAEGLLTLLRVQ